MAAESSWVSVLSKYGDKSMVVAVPLLVMVKLLPTNRKSCISLVIEPSTSTVWLFQLAVSMAVIPLAIDTPNTGSVSALLIPPTMLSAVLACKAYGTLINWLVSVTV